MTADTGGAEGFGGRGTNSTPASPNTPVEEGLPGQVIGVQVAGGDERTDAEALARGRARARRMIALSYPGHPGVTPGFDENRSLQTEILVHEYAKAYAETMVVIAGAPVGRAAETAGERAAIRGLDLALDPRAGFRKGFAVGFSKAFLAGDVPVTLPSVNPSFDRGVKFGEFAGNVLAPISRSLTGFPR